MKRIISIIMVILILSVPANALIKVGTPIEVICSGTNYFRNMESAIDSAIIFSSTYCPFASHSYRIRIKIRLENDNKTYRGFLYTAEWYIRVDKESTKFIYMGSMSGAYKFGEEELVASELIDHTDELLAPPEPTPEEYVEYDENTKTY